MPIGNVDKLSAVLAEQGGISRVAARRQAMDAIRERQMFTRESDDQAAAALLDELGAKVGGGWHDLTRAEQEKHLAKMRVGRERARQSRAVDELKRRGITTRRGDLVRHHEARKPHARAQDDAATHKRTVSRDDPAGVVSWLKRPGALDVEGVDTAEASRQRARVAAMSPEERRAHQLAARKARMKRIKGSGPVSRSRATGKNMNMGLQKVTIASMADARGIDYSSFDFEHGLDPSLTLEENWEVFESQARNAGREYALADLEGHYIDQLKPRKRRALFESYPRKALLAMARDHGATTRMTKDELVQLVLKTKAWRR